MRLWCFASMPVQRPGSSLWLVWGSDLPFAAWMALIASVRGLTFPNLACDIGAVLLLFLRRNGVGLLCSALAPVRFFYLTSKT